MKAGRIGMTVAGRAARRGAGLGQDPLAVVTEIHARAGQGRGQAGRQTDWQTPKPLLSLRAGDQVRVPSAMVGRSSCSRADAAPRS